MPITVTPIAGLSDDINDVRLRTARIVNEKILPNEALLWHARGSGVTEEERAEAKALRGEIQAKVKAEGLWAPHLPPEYGGLGIDFMAHAYMNEILAYAVGAASLFGVVAPNSGNQTILVKYGTEEQKKKWLLPLVEGTMQSGAHAAHTIVRRLKGEHPKPFRYHDLGTLAVISRFRAVAKIGPLRVGGLVGWLLWLVVHITFLTGFKNRFGALTRWAISFVGRGRYERALTGRWVAGTGPTDDSA